MAEISRLVPPGRRGLPLCLLVQEAGGGARTVPLGELPVSIGRAPGCSVVVPDAFVSRQHATVRREGAGWVLEDAGSRHGTFLNGQPVTRRLLLPRDVIQLGSTEAPAIVVQEVAAPEPTATLHGETMLARLHGLNSGQSDLERLRWFLQAARDLSNARGMEHVLASLLEATLALAGMERGFVFLRGEDGGFTLAHGSDAAGRVLTGAETVSRTALRRAAEGSDLFLITDSISAEGRLSESIVAHSIRHIICIPLRRQREFKATDPEGAGRQVFGALYLDSRAVPKAVTEMDHELLRTIAREAAALVDIAQLAEVEARARQHQEELAIAARIQQGLMAIQIPRVPFAAVEARSLACSAVGGDFFDVVAGPDLLNVVLVDVSGKGISAAMLASTLQGMLYVQLQAGLDLDAIAAATNSYLTAKNVGKYATMLLLRLHADGRLLYMNCGHIQPRVCGAGGASVMRLEEASLPVGLLPGVEYRCAETRLPPGARVLLVSDGFTEAEDAAGNCFGDERLDRSAECGGVGEALDHLLRFCAGHPANDDRTIVQLSYCGAG